MPRALSSALPLSLFAFAACAGPAPGARSPEHPLSPPGGGRGEETAPKAAGPKEQVAVLPIDDETLFRSERAKIRDLLAREIARRAPKLEVLPLSKVDTAVRPVSEKSGERCAFAGSPLDRRAHDKGWLTTDLMHVFMGMGKQSELWVNLDDRTGTRSTFTGTWNPKLDRIAAYRAALTSMVRKPGGGGVLGGLMAGGFPDSKVTVGALTLCESKTPGSCAPETKEIAARGEEMARCFGGADEESRSLLFDGSGHCEIAGLDDSGGAGGRLEACLCKALAATPAAGRAGRRTLDLSFQAPDLAGKAQPWVGVVEAPHNLFAETGWRSVQEKSGNKKIYVSKKRLVVDNLDALAPPLGRCALPSGSVVVADVTVSELGTVTGVKVRSGAGNRAVTRCIEKAISRGTFTCTDDGKPATLLIAASWP